MNALDENPDNESRPAGVGPGDRLQAARIQRGLSLEDVAERMHLSANILEALEENNFEEITAPIFVKGYLRAYARIVSLDEDEMIQQYMDYYSEEDPPISSTSNMAPELSVADARIKWTTYLVIVVLVALLGAWWWNKEKSEEGAISLDTQPADAPAVESAAAEVATSNIEAVSENGVTEAAAAPVIEPVSEPVSEPGALETAAAEPATAPEPAAAAEPIAAPETAAVEEPVAEQAEGLDEAAVMAAATGEDTPAAVVSVGGPIAPSGSDKLFIVVNADTWADIKDASDYQMVYDLLRADQTLELVGSAPFSVFLGNGHGVELRLNDEEINFSNRIRDDNTARLKIGG